MSETDADVEATEAAVEPGTETDQATEAETTADQATGADEAADTDYDIVLWGATGFTGELVAEALAWMDKPDIDWAIAGRNPAKLEALREDLAEYDPALADLDYLIGDATDQASLETITEQTDVVCATVGPFAEYGSAMVEACLEHDTDYCDLAGEVQWLHEMVASHHDEAAEQGTRIVHACGFDSVPSDIGTLLVQSHADETRGAACSSVQTYVSGGSLNFSSGTLASMVEMYDAIDENPDLRALLEDPYSLVGDTAKTTVTDGGTQRPRFDRDVKSWTAPFMMAVINEKVVHRTNALLGYPWGRSFEYREVLQTGDGLSGATIASAVAGGMALTERLMSSAPLRERLQQRLLPNSGSGPEEETIRKGSIDIRLRGTGMDPERGEEFAVEAHVGADYGAYGASALMTAAAAQCLALDDVDSPLDGGVLTPASGIGLPLADRLRDAGLTLEVEEASTRQRGS